MDSASKRPVILFARYRIVIFLFDLFNGQEDYLDILHVHDDDDDDDESQASDG